VERSEHTPVELATGRLLGIQAAAGRRGVH